MPTQTWSPETYQKNAAFVPKLGAPVLELLNPQPSERILDLGCGDGTLTEAIAQTGATVVGVDSSEAFLRAAKSRGIDARRMDVRELTFNNEFDAVFTNAVLHWVFEADNVIKGVRRALRPDGRFVGEFGGHTNVAAITAAAFGVMGQFGITPQRPWYFPTPTEYGAKLTAHGFTVESIDLIPRPTSLRTRMDGWLTTFGTPLLSQFPEEQRAEARSRIIEALRPILCDEAGQWTADYVRLRFSARLSNGTV